MYAVIETGGKQYRVEVGTELQVELLDVEPGKTITLDRVLLVADGDESSIGRPLVADAAVSAEVVRQIRGEKLISFKYRPKARSRVKKGHRQELTVLRISDIMLDGKSAAKSVRKAQDDAKTERQRLEEAAAAQATRDAELAAKLAVGTDAPVTASTKGKAAPARDKTATTRGRTGSTAGKTAATKGEAATATATSTGRSGSTATKVAAPTSGKAKAASKAPSKASADAAATDTPKRGRAKPAPAGDPVKADAPKRSRPTKKDE